MHVCLRTSRVCVSVCVRVCVCVRVRVRVRMLCFCLLNPGQMARMQIISHECRKGNNALTLLLPNQVASLRETRRQTAATLIQPLSSSFQSQKKTVVRSVARSCGPTQRASEGN